jgi:hypothetical protein
MQLRRSIGDVLATERLELQGVAYGRHVRQIGSGRRAAFSATNNSSGF